MTISSSPARLKRLNHMPRVSGATPSTRYMTLQPPGCKHLQWANDEQSIPNQLYQVVAKSVYSKAYQYGW